MADLTILEGDCLDVLATLPTDSVNLIVADPPYNMGKAVWDTFASDVAFRNFNYSWIAKCYELLVRGGALYVFNTPYNCAWLLTDLVRLGMEYRNWITWDKRDGQGGKSNQFLRRQESILYFTKPGAQHTFNADAVRVPYESTSRIAAAAKTGIIKNGKRWFPNPNGKLCGDVWHITSERHKSKVDGKTQKLAHITPKPKDMIERIIAASSNKGDTVLDPFAGSGTTLFAAYEMDRHSIGIEIMPEYVQLIERRKETLSMRLPGLL